MTKNRLPRISAALLVGAFAVVPVAASIALAPSAAAIAVVDGEEPGFDADALAEKGIAPLSLETGDAADGIGDATFLDEDGTAVEHADSGTDGLTEEELAKIQPLDAEFLDEDGNAVEHADEGPGDLTAEELARIQPLDAEIVPISANVNEGLATGAVVAIVAGGVAVVGGGVALGLRARRKA
ncbi:hypothetical protein [Xylanimonas cellulosilytica]|nr:hypothetical protein [Xylanimonas cellulosilytica]